MACGLWLILPPAPGLAARSRRPGARGPQQPGLAPRRTVQGWATVERHRIVDLKPHRPVPRGSTTTTAAASDPTRHASRQDKTPPGERARRWRQSSSCLGVADPPCSMPTAEIPFLRLAALPTTLVQGCRLPRHHRAALWSFVTTGQAGSRRRNGANILSVGVGLPRAGRNIPGLPQ